MKTPKTIAEKKVKKFATPAIWGGDEILLLSIKEAKQAIVEAIEEDRKENPVWKQKAICKNCGADLLEKCPKCKDQLWFMEKVELK